MQTLVKLGVLSFILPGISLASPVVMVRSRNMPTHCEYVYQVNSEIEIRWQPGLQDAFLAYELFDEYSEVWQSQPNQAIACSQTTEDDCRAFLAFESMSTSQHYLYRQIRFLFVDEHGEALTGRFLSSFGREFGEQCYETPDQTPFRSRPVIQQ